MSHSSNSHAAPEAKVPTALVNRSRADWNTFTHAIVINCVAIAVLLLLMLIFLRIL